MKEQVMEKLATNVRRFLFAYTLFIIILLILLISSCVEFEWWKISYANSNGFNATVSLGLWKACYKETSAPEVCKNYGSEDQLRYRITDLKTIRVFTIIPPAALAPCFLIVILMSLRVCQIRVQLYLVGTVAFFTLLSEIILCITIGLSSFSNASPSKPNWVIIPTSFTKTKEEYAIGFIVTCVCLILTSVALLIMLALYLYVIRHSREYAHKKKEAQIEEAVRQYVSNKNYDVHRETDSEQSYEKKIKKSEKRISKKSTSESSLYNSPQYYYTNEYQYDDSYQQETIPRRPYTNLTYERDSAFDYDNQNGNLPTNGNYILPPSKDQSIYYGEKEISNIVINGKLPVGEYPERVIKTYQSNTSDYCSECGATNNTFPVNKELKTFVSLNPRQEQPQQAAAHRDERAMEEDAFRSPGSPKFFYQEHLTYEPQNRTTQKIQTELTTYSDRPRALRHGQRQMSPSKDYCTVSVNKSPEMKRKSFYEGKIITNGYCDECAEFFSNDKVESACPNARSLSRKSKHSQSVSGVRSSSGDHPPVRVLKRVSTSNAPHTSRHHPAALY